MREPCRLPTPTCHGPSPKCFLHSFVFATILGNFYNLVKEEVRIGKRSPADKPGEGGKGTSSSKTEPWKASSQLRVGLALSCALSLGSLGLGLGKHSINFTLKDTVWSEERCPGVCQSAAAILSPRDLLGTLGPSCSCALQAVSLHGFSLKEFLPVLLSSDHLYCLGRESKCVPATVTG